jgi:hypothetical protein
MATRRRALTTTLAFFQACWQVLKEDIMKGFREFHARGKFERSLNATFIALIPKIPGVVDPNNFRPISLVSDITKLLLTFSQTDLRWYWKRLSQSRKIF